MLAKLKEEMPRGPGWLYEPKWDGFRAVVFRDGDDMTIVSRDSKPLERYFPELPDALKAILPKRCVIDGEVVIADEKGLDFEALLLRIHPAASRVKMLAETTPASFVAFDLLAEGTKDLCSTEMTARRSRLEKALEGFALPDEPTEKDAVAALADAPRVMLTPQTDDADEADRWFEEFERIGLDGVIAKPADLLYVPGERVMVKVKHRRTADCVIGGYRLSKAGDGIGSLLLGLYDDGGVLHYVGHTSSFKAAQRRELLAELKPLEGGTSFGGGRAPGGQSRWTGGKDVSWVQLEPKLVCEVSFDYMQGARFRHAARFVRWRPEKPPRECGFDQLPRFR
jgi:ATP-dependent DNA ligase